MLFSVGLAVLGVAPGCTIVSKTDMPFCGSVVDYAVPSSLDVQVADSSAARGADLGSFCSFFAKPAFQCFKHFPACAAGGAPVKLCRSVCKSAIEQDFAACPCDGDSSCVTQFTDNCKSDAFFGANAGNCTTHAGKLFSSNELGTGYYVGIALGAFALLFTCCMFAASTQMKREQDNFGRAIALQTDDLDAEFDDMGLNSSAPSHSTGKRKHKISKKERHRKKRNRVIKHYSHLGTFIGMHTLLCVLAATALPWWTLGTSTARDPSSLTNTTVTHHYGLFELNAFGGTDELQTMLVAEQGLGSWQAHCNSTRWKDTDLNQSPFCGFWLEAMQACMIGAAVASVLLFLMQICACNPLAYSWDGALLTGLQFFALAFSLAMWPWMMEEYWQGEGGRVALDCATLGYFAASCHSRFGSSYKMCALALVLTVPQYYCYHTAHKYIMNEGDAFEKETGLKLSPDGPTPSQPMPPGRRMPPAQRPPPARAQQPHASQGHPRAAAGGRRPQPLPPQVPVNASYREFPPSAFAGKGQHTRPQHYASPVREEGVI